MLSKRISPTMPTTRIGVSLQPVIGVRNGSALAQICFAAVSLMIATGSLPTRSCGSNGRPRNRGTRMVWK
jgi:hypothetical protein